MSKKITRVDCKKHGICPAIFFSMKDSVAGQWSIKVCFKCYVEKATKGLQVFK